MKKAYLLILILIFPAILEADQSQEKYTVSIDFSGVSSGSMRETMDFPDVKSHYFALSSGATVKAKYKDIYPGIDMVCIGDDYSVEYIFILSPGADPNLIKWKFNGAKAVTGTGIDAIKMKIGKIEIHQSQPVIHIKKGKEEYVRPGFYNATEEDFLVNTDLPGDITGEPQNLKLNIVTAGGQPNGPAYNFYFSKYELTSQQYAYFLNDAEANRNSARGSNMYFDVEGNVWCNPEKKQNRDEMFTLKKSYITYDASKPVGHRYDILRDKSGKPIFANYPVSGVSWIGSLKYCNWLTIDSGRGLSELCYTEGTNASCWAPITATNWTKGIFTDTERTLWTRYKGFRLPMVGTNSVQIKANPFGEFYKTAAWNRKTNSIYAFGRDTFDVKDANFLDKSNNKGAMPVGSFAGTNSFLKGVIRPDANTYGVLDLSGNVSEWTSDFYANQTDNILLFGNSWNDIHTPLNLCKYLPSHNAGTSTGIRILTTYMPSYTVYIHMLVSFFSEGLLVQDKGEEILLPPETKDSEELSSTEVTSDKKFKTDDRQPPMEINFSGHQTPPDNQSLPVGIIRLPTESRPPSPPQSRPESGRETSPSESQPPQFQAADSSAPPSPPVIPSYILSLNSLNPNAGVPFTAVSVDKNGLGNGVTPFTRLYNANTFPSVTAASIVGTNKFSKWQIDGVDAGTNLSITVFMDTNHTTTAIYIPRNTYNLIVNSQNPTNNVSITGVTVDNTSSGDGLTTFTRTYYEDTSVSLTAPNIVTTNKFLRWNVDGVNSGTNPSLTVLMNTNHTVTAIYIPINTYVLTVNSQNPTNNVSITGVTVDNTSSGDGLTTFLRIYNEGTAVSLTAPATASTNTFLRWDLDGVNSGTNLTLSGITMSTNRTATAIYTYIPPVYQLSVDSQNPNAGVPITGVTPDNTAQGNGTTHFDRFYNLNVTANLTAPQTASTNTFIRWQLDGVDYSTNMTIGVFMNTNHSVLAVYIYIPPTIPNPPVSPSGL